jgi:hypothetical protein
VKIFGREPAVILALVSAAIQLLVTFGLPLSTDETASINAVAAAALGLLTAAFVARDQLVPAILGFTQAALTLGLAFGLHMSQANIGVIMAFSAAAVALFIRTQVTAMVALDGSTVPRQSLYARAA